MLNDEESLSRSCKNHCSKCNSCKTALDIQIISLCEVLKSNLHVHKVPRPWEVRALTKLRCGVFQIKLVIWWGIHPQWEQFSHDEFVLWCLHSTNSHSSLATISKSACGVRSFFLQIVMNFCLSSKKYENFFLDKRLKCDAHASLRLSVCLAEIYDGITVLQKKYLLWGRICMWHICWGS